jgi:hypothetical protein
MVQHRMLVQHRYYIRQAAGTIEAFLGQQVGMAGAEEKNTPVVARGICHPGSHFQQPGTLTDQDTGLELAHRLQVTVEGTAGKGLIVVCH